MLFAMLKRGAYCSLTLQKTVEVLKEVEKDMRKKCDITKDYGILSNTLKIKEKSWRTAEDFFFCTIEKCTKYGIF